MTERGQLSLSVHLRVGGEPYVVCHTYADRGPILSISTVPTDLTIALAETSISVEDLSFAHALLSAAKTFLAECERHAEPGVSAA